MKLVAGDLLHPHIDRVRPLEDAATAIEELRNRRVLGNLVVRWT